MYFYYIRFFLIRDASQDAIGAMLAKPAIYGKIKFMG
jgi:hypothetical protein